MCRSPPVPGCVEGNKDSAGGYKRTQAFRKQIGNKVTDFFSISNLSSSNFSFVNLSRGENIFCPKMYIAVFTMVKIWGHPGGPG